jgi:hypothetical protein
MRFKSLQILAPAIGLNPLWLRRWCVTQWTQLMTRRSCSSYLNTALVICLPLMASTWAHSQPRESLNPDVHADTINETICIAGYTKTVRPSTNYTNGVKRLLLSRAGLSYEDKRDYELDHIIPLALGGHPRSLTNLMLQPWEGEDGAKRKDKLEVKLQCLVCTGKISLDEARFSIYNDWQAAAKQYQHQRCSRKRFDGD